MDTGEALALVGGLTIGLVIGWLIWLLNAPSRRRFEAVRRELDVTRQRLASQDEPSAEVIDLSERIDRDRIAAERDAANVARAAAEADREQAEADADRAVERARVAEARLLAAQRAITEIRAQLETASTTPIRPAVIDLRDGSGTVVTVRDGPGLPPRSVGDEHSTDEHSTDEHSTTRLRPQPDAAPSNEFDRTELVEQIANLQEQIVNLRRQVAARAIDADQLRVDLARRRVFDRELIATLDRLRGLRERLDQLDS